MQNAESRAHSCCHAYGGSAANDHFANGFGDFTVVRVRVADFFGGKAALVKHDHAALRPFDRLGYVHAFDVLTKSNCSGGRGRKRIVPFAIQRPGGIWVKPLVAMIEVMAIMEL